MGYLETKEDWWTLVNENWEDLTHLVNVFHPGLNQVAPTEYPITAQAAEAICEMVRVDIRSGGAPPCINELKANKDGRLLDVFNQTWFGAPESSEVRNLPGFGLLCDLCSEGYVLEEEQPGLV